MDIARLTYLFRQYEADKATDNEKDELFTVLSNDANTEEALQYFESGILNTVPGSAADAEKWQPVLARIMAKKPARVLGGWWKYAAAAAIIICLATGAWFFFAQKQAGKLTVTPVNEIRNDVPPGGNKAVLTLANGTVITLDSAANGKLAQQGKSTVIKSGDGKLVYDAKEFTIDHSPLTYNTLATPRGGQYQLVLPDGSQVWLNAASSIRYPTAFTGDERSVEITGEAYFEVATLSRPGRDSGQKMPFTVKVNGMEVEVLGTHFNINSYADEGDIKTTLLEGSVKVVNGQSAIGKPQSAILKPGEQVSLSQSSHLSQPIPVQTDEVMAWKNGLFNFNHASLTSVMQQLARWYDVDVKYEGNIPSATFRGKITRDLNLSQVLLVLQDVEVKFRIEGKTLIVTN